MVHTKKKVCFWKKDTPTTKNGQTKFQVNHVIKQMNLFHFPLIDLIRENLSKSWRQTNQFLFVLFALDHYSHFDTILIIEICYAFSSRLSFILLLLKITDNFCRAHMKDLHKLHIKYTYLMIIFKSKNMKGAEEEMNHFSILSPYVEAAYFMFKIFFMLMCRDGPTL